MTAGTAADRHLALLRSIVEPDVTAVRNALSDPTTDLIGFLRFAHQHQARPRDGRELLIFANQLASSRTKHRSPRR